MTFGVYVWFGGLIDRRTDFCCICVFVIPGLSKVITSPDNPDIRTEGRNPV